MTEEKRRQHRHRARKPGPAAVFWRKHRLDLIVGAALIVGIFLLVGPLAQWLQPLPPDSTAAPANAFSLLLQRVGQAITGELKLVAAQLMAFVFTANWAVKLGWLLLLVAIVGIPLRLRWWALNSQSLSAAVCPRCGGRINMIHRHWSDRALSKLIPVRRYRCSNHSCGWKGLRVDRRGMVSLEESTDGARV